MSWDWGPIEENDFAVLYDAGDFWALLSLPPSLASKCFFAYSTKPRPWRGSRSPPERGVCHPPVSSLFPFESRGYLYSHGYYVWSTPPNAQPDTSAADKRNRTLNESKHLRMPIQQLRRLRVAKEVKFH
jgi:hypothetical protein